MGNLGSVKLNLAVCYTAFLEDYAHRNLSERNPSGLIRARAEIRRRFRLKKVANASGDLHLNALRTKEAINGDNPYLAFANYLRSRDQLFPLKL